MIDLAVTFSFGFSFVHLLRENVSLYFHICDTVCVVVPSDSMWKEMFVLSYLKRTNTDIKSCIPVPHPLKENI